MKRNIFVAAMMLTIVFVAGYNWSTAPADPPLSDAAITVGNDDVVDVQDSNLETPGTGKSDGYSLDGSGGEPEQAERSRSDFVDKVSSLPQTSLDDLPAEAINTIELIYNNGPFPFSKDDSVFQNREGFLPARDVGYYREYTVITPGEDDRGARRIVGGSGGELFYTADHYNSFTEIDQNS